MRHGLALVLGFWMAAAAGASTQDVNLPLRAGASLEAALAALNAQGHRIVYSSALVTPAMKLRTAPRAARIEILLAEILTPWQLRALPAGNGDWLVVAAPPLPATGENISSDEPVDLQTVDVTASRYGLATPGSSTVFLDRKGVEQIPHRSPRP